MIYARINKFDFINRFNAIRPDNFSHKGLGALFDYLDELSDELEGGVELDVIALCCDFSEYELSDALEMVGCSDIEELADSTTVITVNGTDNIIIQNF